MINFDFEFKRPTSWKDALTMYQENVNSGKKVVYYAGGTEFISRARMNEIDPEVVIDLKNIPECTEIKKTEGEVIYGAAVTLTEVEKTKYYPLLSKVATGIATKTARNKITIGGNLMSNLPYKEALLPFLLADSELIIATDDGLKNRPVSAVFTKKIGLKGGEFIVQTKIDEQFTTFPFYYEKNTKQSSVNYPIITIASLLVNNEIRVAVSGYSEYPFSINGINKTDSSGKQIKKVLHSISSPVLDDMHASKDYREFVFERTLTKLFKQMEVVS